MLSENDYRSRQAFMKPPRHGRSSQPPQMTNNYMMDPSDDRSQGGYWPMHYTEDLDDEMNQYQMANQKYRPQQMRSFGYKPQNQWSQQPPHKKRKGKSKNKHRKHLRKYSSSTDEHLDKFNRNINQYVDDDINQRIPDHSQQKTSQNPFTDSNEYDSENDSATSSSGGSSNSSDSRRARAKKDKKKNKKKQKKKDKKDKKKKRRQQQMSQQHSSQIPSRQAEAVVDFQRIIEEERLATRLRIDNYAMLLYLTDINDEVVREIFANHVRIMSGNGRIGEQSNLYQDLQAKTEQEFQAFLENNMKLDQI